MSADGPPAFRAALEPSARLLHFKRETERKCPMNGSTLETPTGQPQPSREGALGAARNTLKTGYEKTARSMHGAVGYSRSHPVTVSLIALGAGLGIGMLLLPARHRRRRAGLAGAIRSLLRV
jgi:hypothetical protein